MATSKWGRTPFLVAAIVCALPPAAAQSFPIRPLHLVVNSAPAAGPDLMSRMAAERLGPRLGQAVVVENRVGASGGVGAGHVKRAAPDGHTLLFSSDQIVLSQVLAPGTTANVVTDFQPIIQAASVDFFLVTAAGAGAASSVRELLELARGKPGALSYGSGGAGTPQHLGMELLKQRTATDFLHVPYKGMAQAVADLLAGRIHATLTGYPAFVGQLPGGKLRILAIASPTRSPLQPHVPTLREAGVPDAEVEGYFFVLAPLGTAPAIVSRINAEFNAVFAQDDFRAELTRRSITTAGGSPARLGFKLRSELLKWTRVIKAAGIQ